MTKKELLTKLDHCCNNSDVEAAHSEANKLLLEYIDDPQITHWYDTIEKWYA